MGRDMFCEKCGAEIDGDAAFCTECGAVIREFDPADVTLEKKNGWIIGISIAGGVLVLILLIGVMFFMNHSKYIDLVKNGHPALYPDTTYNEAFSSFFTEPKWEYFESEAEEDIVEFRGKCFLLDSDVVIKMTIQFVVDEDEDVSFHTLSLDGKEQSDFLSVLILAGIFEKYEDGNSDGKLEMPDEEEDSDISEDDFDTEAEEYEDTEFDNDDEIDEDYTEYGYLVADNENLYGDMAHFALYDLDNDGIEELIVQGGNSFADTMNKVYTIADNQAEYLGEFAGPVSLFPAESGIGLYASYSRMDNITMYYVLKSGGDGEGKGNY